MKQCKHCLEQKLFSEFNKNNSKDGYQSVCKACRSVYGKEYYKRNGSRIKKKIEERRANPEFKKNENERNKQWRLKHPTQFKARSKRYREDIKYRFARTKSAAKKRHKDFDLTFDQFKELCDQPCYYCNNELGSKTKTLAGFDRIDNSIGYITNNVVSCCSVCNIMRGSNLTQEETLIAVKAILRLRRRSAPKSNT